MIKLVDVQRQNDSLREPIRLAVQEVIDSGWYVQGPEVAKFETRWAAYIGADHAIGVSNGLDAIRVALQALRLDGDDGVIIPANTYSATAMAIASVGLLPILVDALPETFQMDVDKVPEAYDFASVIMPVHLQGMPCDMDAVMDVADLENLIVIEDSAQAHESTWRGKACGTFGRAGCFSFFPGKNLGALGDAGAIVTDDDDLARDMRAIRNQGQHERYQHSLLGFTARMDAIQGAVLDVKLSFLREWNRRRAKIREIYIEELQGIGDLQFQYWHQPAEPAWHLFVIRTRRRDELQAWLRNYDIETIVHYPTPIHLQEAFRWLGHQVGDFPVAEELAKTSLSLPMHPHMTNAEIDEVITRIKDFYAM